MQTLSFIATLNNQQTLEILVCEELPDMIHAVKRFPTLGLELFLDAAVEWSPELEEAAAELLLESVGIYA
jgi:hypothetical protein